MSLWSLEGDESAQDLWDRLAGEILESMNDDHTFRLFDVPMSSAFAILSLAAVGRRGRILHLARSPQTGTGSLERWR
jgi:hypothetical protein